MNIVYGVLPRSRQQEDNALLQEEMKMHSLVPASTTIHESTATRTKKVDKQSKQSPTASMRSPRKKKRRRQRPKLVVGDIALDSSNGESDDEDMNDVLPCPNKLFSSTESKDDDLPDSYTTASLEKKNARLEKRVVNLNRSQINLVMRIETLSTKVSQLELHSRNGGDMTTYPRAESDEVCKNMEENPGEETTTTTTTKRWKRIHDENTELACKLSKIITVFLMTTPQLSDKRKFPKRRLAKIVIESLLSFEWAHSEIVRQVSSRFSPHNDVLSELSALLNMKRCRHNKHKAAVVVDGMWDAQFLDGEAQQYMINRVRAHLREHVFTPWKILKAMDISGFNLSLSGIEVLRRVDATERYSRGIIPSKSTILRSARMVDAAAENYCPFSMIGRSFCDADTTEDDGDDDFGEGFEFDAVKITSTLLDAFGLTGEAKHRPIKLALTSDGAQLTNTLSHVATGLKFNDMAMRDPMTKSPLLLHGPDSLVQSRNLCFPLRIVIAKDNKATLDGFRPLYNQFKTGEVATALQCRQFKLSFPADMKLQWGALGNGGAAKVKENFCYVCPCRSSTLHVPRDNASCDIYPEVRGKLAGELDVLNDLIRNAIDADAQQDENEERMHVRRVGEVAIEDDVLDIDYQPSSGGRTDKAVWVRHITRELVKRSLPVTGTLVDRQLRLRSHLVNELRSRDVSRMFVESEPKEQAMYLVLQAVVCILHLENRIGLKSIESILRSGISNARKGVLDWTVSTSINGRQDEYVERITTILRNEILGTVLAPSQWRFPLNEEGMMGTLSMDNNRTRLVMNMIELLIVESFPTTDEKRDLLLQCFPHYRAAIIILTDATDDEIAAFQSSVDAWFGGWVQVYGREGCTNYTHMMSSGHVMRYMKEWKCLHRYSQQGWEALNALIKSYFFRRTNRGGLARNSTRKSKLLGIARWLQRRVMWYSGNGDSLFEDVDDDSSYECPSGDDDNDDVDMEAEEMSESGSNNREDDESIDDTSDDENNE